MHITLTALQFISVCMGIGLLCYFWGCWTALRDIQALRDDLRKLVDYYSGEE